MTAEQTWEVMRVDLGLTPGVLNVPVSILEANLDMPDTMRLALRAGWEPFAADFNTIWLRRKVTDGT